MTGIWVEHPGSPRCDRAVLFWAIHVVSDRNDAIVPPRLFAGALPKAPSASGEFDQPRQRGHRVLGRWPSEPISPVDHIEVIGAKSGWSLSAPVVSFCYQQFSVL